MWILGLKGLILLYIHSGKKVFVNNLIEIRSCKIVGVYYKILLKLQYNFSSNTFGPILWDIEKHIWRLSDEYFFISSVGCTKSPIIIYVDHQHNEMTFENCDFLVDPA